MYKHWKKIALALTALFWASCDETSSVEGPDLYGCPPDIRNPMPAMPESSSSVNSLPSSSSNEQIACKRQSRIYDTRENGRNYISVDYYECKDGTICEDYGYSDSFSCTDYQGKYISYTKDEFNSKYYVESERIHAEVESYHESSSSFAETNLSSNTEAVKPLINCYNDTALNDKGQSFDIISCDDGNKYLRDHSVYSEVPKEREKVPKDVQIFAPTPGSEKAANCTKGPRKCHDYKLIDENGNTVKNVGGCNYNTITCPAKP